MAEVYQIDLKPEAQIFEIDLGKRTYKMKVYYNSIMSTWMLDLYETNDTAIVLGTPLVTGVNILENLRYKNIDGSLILYTEGDADHIPNKDELGTKSLLYFLKYKDEK